MLETLPSFSKKWPLSWASHAIPTRASTLRSAIQNKDLNTVSQLLQQSTAEIDEPDGQNLTAIDYALLSGDPKMQALVLGFKIGKKVDEALLFSEQNSEVASIVATEVKNLLSLNPAHMTELHTAAFQGDLNRVISLSPSAETLNRTTISPFTPLQCAVLGGHTEMVDKLISLGASLHLLTLDRKSLLHLAAATGNPKMIEKIIALKGSSSLFINGMDVQGRTPLHYALVHEAPQAARTLIEKGADPFFGGSMISPFTVFIHQAQTRCNSRDPLHLDVGSAIMFAAIIGSWIVSHPDQKEGLQSFASLASFLQLIPGLMPQTTQNSWLGLLSYPAFTLALNQGSTTFSDWLHGFQTATVIKSWIQALQAASHSKETVRPIRNVVIHTVNALYFLNRFIREAAIHRAEFES